MRIGKAFSYPPLENEAPVPVGAAMLTALPTSGHMPESMTYRLGECAIFTGDTLFLHGVGRPDLDAEPEEGRRKARRLSRSLHRLAELSNVTANVPPTPPNHETIIPRNETGAWLAEEVMIDLEAGANRCTAG